MPGAQHLERRVQRRRLAAARGTGREHDAVRARDHLAEQLERVGGHAELRQRDAALLLVEQAQHHALAAQRGHGRDAHVHLAVLQAQADAAVLRQPPLGDVELRHDLDAADDRGREVRRRRGRGLQHAVHAIAHVQAVGVALEVHVRGARLERLDQQQVHEPHHRRLVGEVQEVVERDLVGVLAARLAAAEAGDQAFRRHGVGRVHAADRAAQVVLAEPLERDRHAEGEPQVVERERLDRVAPGADDDRAVRRASAAARAYCSSQSAVSAVVRRSTASSSDDRVLGAVAVGRGVHGRPVAFGAVAGHGGHQREPSGRFVAVESGFVRFRRASAGFFMGSPIWMVSPFGTMRALTFVSSSSVLWLLVASRSRSMSSSLETTCGVRNR